MKENIFFKWSLVLSIVIVANLFFNYSLSLIFNGPNMEEFCPREKVSQEIIDKKLCEENDGIWRSNQIITEGSDIKTTSNCDLYTNCQNRYESAKEIYEKKVFIALIIIGSIILIASAFIKNNSVLSVAFPFVAVLDLIIASIRYWQYSDELLKVSILFVALVTLIYLSIKKFTEKKHDGI